MAGMRQKIFIRYSMWFILPALGFYAFAAKAEKRTIYVVNRSSRLDQLDIHVDLEKKHADKRLILKGPSMGVASQVINMRCDSMLLSAIKPGEWLVPSRCRKIEWQTSLAKTSEVFASAQQSSRLNNFILFSEVSSLPRLQDASPEFMQIALSDVKNTVPELNQNHQIPLPAFSQAPLFVLINAKPLGMLSSGPMRLAYLLDNPQNKSQLPNMDTHLRGLQWLNQVVPAKHNINFTIGWLGVSAPRPSLTGAAGSDVLLVNYPVQGQFPFGHAMLLYVALHEAFHHLAANYHNQPPWIAESLASYYGIRALQQALPGDPDVAQLMARFQEGGKNFKEGLLAINNKVEKGDRSEYGAFYTKGISFWAAVDKTLQQSHQQNLDRYVLSVLNTNHTDAKQVLDLEKELHLSPKEWTEIRTNFLG